MERLNKQKNYPVILSNSNKMLYLQIKIEIK